MSLVQRPDTFVSSGDRLFLTCTRSGACCRDKAIWINPWELACLARARGCAQSEFRDRFTIDGGIRLRMEESLWCSQYVPSSGCSAYAGRPLACRLYPLGRRRKSEKVDYLYRGAQFACLRECPDVKQLPQLSVAEYLVGQEVVAGEAAQDAYLETMQDLAEGALVLLLEGGLATSGDRLTLPRWRARGAMSGAERAATLIPAWLDRLTTPALDSLLGDPAKFIERHHDLLQEQAQSEFGSLSDPAALRAAAALMMALALQLGRSLGFETPDLADRWVGTAKQHGALG